MHLLAAQPGSISDGTEAIDLGQSPGDIVVLSAADTELAALAKAHGGSAHLAGGPSLRLANLMRLAHNLSVDLYVEQVVAQAKLVVVRLLGGRAYWPYGLDEIASVCRAKGIKLACLPGDDKADGDVMRESTLPPEAVERLWRYLVQGGPGNAAQFLAYGANLLGHDVAWREPVPLAPAGLLPQGASLDDLRHGWTKNAPVAAIVFYRALVQAGDLAPIEAMADALRGEGLNVLPVFVASLKDGASAAVIESLFAQARPDIILNATGFAVSAPGRPGHSPFAAADCPVLQMVLSGGTEAAWRDGSHGLSPRDIAMNVALPEVDGRILSRAVSFKGSARRDDATQWDIVAHVPVQGRIAFVAQLAAHWARLRRCPAKDRRIVVVMANYPNKDGRLGNGVGLDTPAATIEVLRALQGAGYGLTALPPDSAALMDLLRAAPTNDLARLDQRGITETLPLDEYRAFFDALPEAVRAAVTQRWGGPESDPFIRDGVFLLPVTRLGNVAIGIQPARGYNIDPASSYHDPDLVPPHNYLAFHAWVRAAFKAHGVIHMGKHGNLEWLPGKSLALSEECFPEVALGPLPNLYPFIVNDPGEGSQAKRRAQAVIIDHLTPPLTRAETYGPLRELERLVDEFYDAANVDPRRCRILKNEIIALIRTTGLDIDCNIAPEDDEAEAFKKLDNHLCELKELQIRDGLHIFGVSPDGGLLTDLIVALARSQRGNTPREASLTRALADDLALGFDPLDCVMGDDWSGPRPAILADQIDGGTAWRIIGDTVERLEILARALVAGEAAPDPQWHRTGAVLDWVESHLRPVLQACGAAEIAGLLAGLDGRFVAPGPSGAPTRGRPDVLPTGRNFYSVDTRVVPTPAAWSLGWKSAGLVCERHLQDHGDWPRIMAVTAWGTSNMRTGGDDIAQALALMGVRPTWDSGSYRVNGFEILPLTVLDRPRVDVTLRVSGFFRDAFPGLIDLVDSAARAVAALDEPADMNPLAARVAAETAEAVARGDDPESARRRASFRVFGSKPGAYGAGLQALIDEGGWQSDDDLARAYVVWGGYAYGAGAEGAAEQGLFETRLASVQAVVQNQDNREHDILDSDDYYQFEGGMTAAVRHLSGKAPEIYHPDHSRPESPRIRTLKEEMARIVRGRAANPKWIAGVMRHGYKGAFEMAATVDYMFAFAATAKVVEDHHFDALCDAYLRQPDVLEFLKQSNPDALRDMAKRFLEALDRGLWRPRRNDVHDMLRALLEAET